MRDLVHDEGAYRVGELRLSRAMCTVQHLSFVDFAALASSGTEVINFPNLAIRRLANVDGSWAEQYADKANPTSKN